MSDTPATAGPASSDSTSSAALEAMMTMNPNSLLQRMQIEVLEATPDRVVGRMPVEGNTQPYGLLHGGASVVLAETLGSIGSALHAGPDRIAVGLDINATHHRAARSGFVTGPRPRCPSAAPWPATRWSSPTTRTSGSAPAGSPACCATPPPAPDPGHALTQPQQNGGCSV